MSWFQLDAESIARRATTAGGPVHLPSLGESVRRGMIGFTVLSVAGFVPWAVFGRTLNKLVGEAGMFLVCMLVFIGLSGPLLHRLILGPGSMARFYKLFAAAFLAYSVLWIAGWMALRGHAGSLTGLFLGTTAMGLMLAHAFEAKTSAIKVVAALFVLNSIGYFVGGIVEGAVIGMEDLTIVDKRTRVLMAMLLWGVFYGMGLGAGLGIAFHECQSRARELIRQSREA